MEILVLDGRITVTKKEFDICDTKDKPEMLRSNLIGWGIPGFCPFNATSTFCYKGNKLMTLSKMTQKVLEFLVSLKGNKVRITIKHDTGSSCFEGISRVKKIGT